MTDPLLDAKQLSMRYGATVALHPIDLSVGVGEFVAIVGVNGCGKSTLLRALAEVLPAAGKSGVVRLHGASHSSRDAARLRAFVPQRPDLAAEFTARAVVGLGRFASAPSTDAVERALHAVGLQGKGDRLVTTLSGGERQRVALARALAQLDGAERPILLLDEPFAGIDPAEVARVVTALRAVAARGAVLCSLHDPGLARCIAHRALVLREGRVVADGPAANILVPTVLTKAYGHAMEESKSWIVPSLLPEPAPFR
ncbi:MAG: ABC transporter ATP-binding protein [Limnohabitans sp.]|jgi:iron complex transport system ATP-binding protein|nr:ABC transporter ATP-binding protein [Limnohabitans sp.]